MECSTELKKILVGWKIVRQLDEVLRTIANSLASVNRQRFFRSVNNFAKDPSNIRRYTRDM